MAPRSTGAVLRGPTTPAPRARTSRSRPRSWTRPRRPTGRPPQSHRRTRGWSSAVCTNATVRRAACSRPARRPYCARGRCRSSKTAGTSRSAARRFGSRSAGRATDLARGLVRITLGKHEGAVSRRGVHLPLVVAEERALVGQHELRVRLDGIHVAIAVVVAEQRPAHVARPAIGLQQPRGGEDGVLVVVDVALAVAR